MMGDTPEIQNELKLQKARMVDREYKSYEDEMSRLRVARYNRASERRKKIAEYARALARGE